MALRGGANSCRALSFESSTQPGRVITKPLPTLDPGSVIIRPLACPVVQYANQIFANGNTRGYRYPTPFVPGHSGIARIGDASSAEVPTLKPGRLAWIHPIVRARDDPGIQIMLGMHAGGRPEGAALMAEAWRDGLWAEAAKVPAENVHLLDEERLVGALGYTVEDLAYITTLMVPYGGLRDVELAAGERVLVAPATGAFGGAAVHVALAMGAEVVAMGRSQEVLQRLKQLDPERVTTVGMSGDFETDKKNIAEAAGGKPLDVFFDISPQAAAGSPHFKAGILSLRHGGRVSLMGGVHDDAGIPYSQIGYRGIRLQGTFMYTPRQADELIRLVESGVLRLGERKGIKCVGTFGLDEWQEAFDAASEKGASMGRYVLLAPNKE